MMTPSKRLSFLILAAAGMQFALAGGSFAASPLKINFVRHASFFSTETKQPKTLDPQVFVQDPAAEAATGPQGIKHAAGVRPPLVEQDAKSSLLYNADGKPLGFDLHTWLSPSGTVTITEQDGKILLEATFKGLKPNGSYSLFENHFDHTPVTFTAMDGTGKTNSFIAQPDGTAKISITLPDFPTHPNAVLLIYNTDTHSHAFVPRKIHIDQHP